MMKNGSYSILDRGSLYEKYKLGLEGYQS